MPFGSTSVNSLSMMTPDSARIVGCCCNTRGKVRRTVLADSCEPLFELPAGPADEGERLENLNGLRSVHDALCVEGGQAPDGIACRKTLSKVHDVLVIT